MRTVLQDLRFGLRTLAKSPGFTAVAVLTLALGIGANTAIFSVVRAVLLQPLPYPEPGRLAVLREYQIGGSDMSVNWLNFQDWLSQNRAFDEMAVYALQHFTLTGAGEPVLMRGATVSASFFSALGVKPLLGRAFTSSDDRPGAPPTVILSYDLWQRRFASSGAVVGRVANLDNLAYTVIGVMPPDFRDPFRDHGVDLYTPVGLNASRWTARDERGSLAVLARLRSGVSLPRARAEMDTIEGRLDQQYPKTNHGIRASVTPLEEILFASSRPTLAALLVAVGLVLLIACANVANLLVARAAVRGQEFAIRQACGAGRSRVIRQLLVESVLLASVGGAVGLLLAAGAMGPLVRLAPREIPRLADTRLNGEVLLFTLVVSALTGIVFGLAPAVGSSKIDVASALKEGAGRATGTLSRERLRASLVVFEIALAALLAVGSGLLMRSLRKAQETDPGFNPEHVLVVELVFPARRYDTPAKALQFDSSAVERLRALPGVRSAGAVLCPPAVGHCWDWFYEVQGHPAASQSALPVAAFNQADATYFETMQVPLRAGRFFDQRDTAQSSPVVIVNQTFARLWWPGESALGKQIRLWTADGKTPYREIVGVTGDIKEDGLDAEQIPEVFMPFAQQPAGAVTLMLRTSGDPAASIAPATQAIHELDKDLPIERIQPMTTYVSASLARRRFSTLLLTLFTALALVLAAVGTYGVNSYNVERRTHEIGVRMALGARRRDVFRLVVGRGARLALAGGAIGLTAALVLARVMASLLYSVRPADPLTFAGVALVLVGVALVASYIPARRATKLDPMTALRYE